jgi:hypothetical protein
MPNGRDIAASLYDLGHALWIIGRPDLMGAADRGAEEVARLGDEVRRLRARVAELEESPGLLRVWANRYEKDGEPGDLGLNCWGWRTIAERLRDTATTLEGESIARRMQDASDVARLAGPGGRGAGDTTSTNNGRRVSAKEAIDLAAKAMETEERLMAEDRERDRPDNDKPPL